ncbi:tagatose 1,6-diphosphate aldolase [Limnochorda pilosa]|uniref:Tagatose-bisphosphate aldolase n=1 Tax=Limnochorda pilosa TaxID=1555112 RepID=A0A0K2SQG6_LIMPI|nr:tagatose 1,6-diphosphate aldolase [Limnochorda pilosa]BAS29237.1 tagatose-bisphosphate aldolase [Limnochorda pilosa]
MHELTIGKLRGIHSISTPAGHITVTALDHRGSLRKALEKTLGRPVAHGEVVEEKLRMVRAFAPHSTAVLLDPTFGAAQAVASGALPGHVGLLVAVEESGYQGSDESRLTRLVEGWSVAKVKQMGASAVKMLLYYHPQSAAAGHQEELVAQVAEECRRHDIAFLLEPMSYPVAPGQSKSAPEFAREKPRVVLETVERLGPLGADLLKLEFPGDPHWEQDEARMRGHCREITRRSPVPWVILSAAESFDVFQRLVEIACEEGASGFMVGRAIWQEAMTLPDPAERDRFLKTQGVSRLEILKAIANRRGRPWSEQAAARPVAEGWHREYGSHPDQAVA